MARCPAAPAAERRRRQLPAPQRVVVEVLAGVAEADDDELGDHLVVDEPAADGVHLLEVPVRVGDVYDRVAPSRLLRVTGGQPDVQLVVPSRRGGRQDTQLGVPDGVLREGQRGRLRGGRCRGKQERQDCECRDGGFDHDGHSIRRCGRPPRRKRRPRPLSGDRQRRSFPASSAEIVPPASAIARARTGSRPAARSACAGRSSSSGVTPRPSSRPPSGMRTSATVTELA